MIKLIMVGYTVLVAKAFGIVDERYPRVDAYVSRLTKRPAPSRSLSAYISLARSPRWPTSPTRRMAA